MLLTPETFLHPQKYFIKLLSKVSAQKEWQIHNAHSDSIWNIILMMSEEQKKKITHMKHFVQLFKQK